VRAIALVLLAACGGSSSDKGGVAVELASVVLADDCGDYGYMPPPNKPPPDPKERQREEVAQKVSAGAAASEAYCPPGQECRSAGFHRGCSQTSMQISFSSNRDTKVVIKKVELLDGTPKYLQDLTPRLPSKWNGSAYEKWDEKLEATKPVSASYALSAPDWSKLGGRMEAQSKKYHLHVVVTVDGTEHSLNKESVAPVVMQPDVVTLR